jgi:hypothetical protein
MLGFSGETSEEGSMDVFLDQLNADYASVSFKKRNGCPKTGSGTNGHAGIGSREPKAGILTLF